MNICVTVNSKYVRYLYVMLLSLYENNAKGNIDLYVLQRDFTEEDKELIRSLSEKYENRVHYIWVDPARFDMFSLDNMKKLTYLSLEIYFRLLIPELLPSELNRVLMLDVDIIINHDISELYNMDMEGYYLAAAPNMAMKNFEVIDEWRVWYGKDRKNWTQYNTGILMWNLTEIRNNCPTNYIFDRALDLKIETATFEEEVFNVLFGESKIKPLSPEKWNYMVIFIHKYPDTSFEVYENNDEIKKNCNIIHYSSQNPWDKGVKNETFSIWWEYAKKTPFYYDFLIEAYALSNKEVEELTVKLDNLLCQKDEVINRKEEQLRYVDLLMDDDSKERILAYLKRNNFIHIILYGAGRIARCLYILLDGTEIVVDDFADKNYFHRSFCGKYVLAPDEVGKHNSDLILITTPYYYDEILGELEGKTSIKIRSIKNVIEESKKE